MKKYLIGLLLLLCMVLTACNSESSTETVGAEKANASANSEDTIKIGMLTAFSGTAGSYGESTFNSAQLAVNEINANGGLLGKQIEIVKGDSASDPNTANEQAKSLLTNEKVSALFSQITSADRNAVRPLFDNSEQLFFYDVLYEGGDYSDNMFVAGEVPEQQLEPVLPYIMNEYKGSKWYIVGEDYVWPHETSAVVKEVVEANNGEVLEEKYVPMGHSDYTSILTSIKATKPDFISLELNAGAAISFMKQFNEFGLAKDIKVIALAVDENTVEAMGPNAEGLLLSASYFYDMPSDANKTFTTAYTDTFGEDAPKPNFITMGSYDAVHLWAKAVEEAGSLEIAAVKEKLPTVSFDGPRGTIQFSADSHHAALPIFLGEVNNGAVDIVKEFGVIDPSKQGKK